VTLKVKYADFKLITRSRSFARPVGSAAELECVVLDLLAAIMPVRAGVRLLGVTLSSLGGSDTELGEQMSLSFEPG
jgi:DNA polymerase-4